ncbi:MAG: hypothetical protein V1859_09870 [archaeon]
MKTLGLLYLLPTSLLITFGIGFLTFLQLSVNLISPEEFFKNPAAIAGLGIIAVILIALYIVTVILYCLMYISIVKMIAIRRENKNPTFSEIFHESKKFLGSYTGLMFVMGFALIGLFLLLIVPGIIFAVFWIFAPFALISDGKGVMESMAYSKKLVTGRWWTVFGYHLLFILIMVGISFGLNLVIFLPVVFLNFIPLLGPIISNILQCAVTMLLMPFGIIFLELFYQKLKEDNAVESPVAKK